MDTQYLGQISLFPAHRIPRGWQMCNGQLLQIATNQALYSIIGATYGGDGFQTFMLPRIKPITCCNAGDEYPPKDIPKEKQYVYCIAVEGIYPMPD